MLGLSARDMLGLAIGEKEIHIAEVAASGGTGRVVRCARFAIPAGMSWDKPQELGAKLGMFLSEQKLGTRRAVVGFPGRLGAGQATADTPGGAGRGRGHFAAGD